MAAVISSPQSGSGISARLCRILNGPEYIDPRLITHVNSDPGWNGPPMQKVKAASSRIAGCSCTAKSEIRRLTGAASS
jgi:hypothetical protein